MIEILILYLINKRELTMYGIQKSVADYFAPLTKPSFGVINPALRRLEKNGCINTRRSLSEGGKQSAYYSITNEGIKTLNKLLLENLSENPVQFFSNARIKIACADVLSKDEVAERILKLKTRALEHKFDADNILNDEYTSLTFYQRIVLENTVEEINNLILLIENLEKENAGNS